MKTAAPRSLEVRIPSGPLSLPGTLDLPAHAHGIVLFAHGSGSSRHSPRNRQVASVLEASDFATLLFDLLTEDEAGDRANVFDIELLGGRLLDAVRWTRERAGTRALPIGLFGASTGAAAALVAAAQEPRVRAVVSRGGRPDLAGDWLERVAVPTLLIVGGDDREVLELNRHALCRLSCAAELVTVRGATHLFEEPGALESVARLAGRWFARHLAPRGGS